MSQVEIIDIDKLYIPYPESLYSNEEIESNQYLIDMKENIKNLPPIKIIDLGNEFSLSDGYRRFSIFRHLNYKRIIVVIA